MKPYSIPQEITQDCFEQSVFNKNGRFRRWIRSAYKDGLTPEDIVVGIIGNPCRVPWDLYQQTLQFVLGVLDDD